MKKDIQLIIGPDGAEIVSGEEAKKIATSDLVRTSAKEKVRQAVDSVVVSLGDVAEVALDVFEVFTLEAASRKIKEQGKMTLSFGINGGVKTDLKLVGAQADAFMTVQLEIPGSKDAKNRQIKDS